MAKTHIAVGDLQIKPGIDLKYCKRIGKYIADKQPNRVIFLGDNGDMPSLSSWDKGKLDFEGRRYRKDVDATRRGMDLLRNEYIKAYNPDSEDLCYGNHEWRIMWAIQKHPEFEGLIDVTDLGYEESGIRTHDYMQWIKREGIYYCHAFENPESLTGGVLSGSIENRLNKLGVSHTQGHQQKHKYGQRYVLDRRLHCLVLGASYPQREKYLGPQGNQHWRGIYYKVEVRNGDYEGIPVTLDFLKRRYK